MAKWRITHGLWVSGLLVLYLGSFGFVTKIPQGTKSMSAVGTSKSPSYEMTIYVAANHPRLNRFGKIGYYPLIRIGEAAGWWRFADDASCYANGAPCLWAVLVHQCDAVR